MNFNNWKLFSKLNINRPIIILDPVLKFWFKKLTRHELTNRKMKTLFVLCVLLCLLQLSFAAPINCSRGAKQLLEEDEQDSVLEKVEGWGTPPKMIIDMKKINQIAQKKAEEYIANLKISELSDNCHDTEVCALSCSTYVPGCKEIAFFTDFTKVSGLNQSSVVRISESYKKVCLRRVVGGERQTTWLDNVLLDIQKSVPLQSESNRITDLNANSGLDKIIIELKYSPEKVYQYISKLTLMLLSIQKMCTEDPEWKSTIEKKVDTYVDRDAKDIEDRFSGNDYLKKDFVDRLKTMWELNDEIKKKFPTQFEGLMNAKSIIKKAFVDEIKNSQDLMVCNCQHFFDQVGNHLPPGYLETAEKECQSKCAPENSSTLSEDVVEILFQ
jgi:hypothetical protein